MSNKKDYYSLNKKWWDKMAEEGCGYSQPWLDLDPAEIQKLSEGRKEGLPDKLADMFPIEIFQDVKGKKILCLASGGGQQSAVFGILGAEVTVVDISDGQLKGDKVAAKHYGYEVRTVQSDMSDLSKLTDREFDLVFQPPSMGWIPDPSLVYSKVARVLKPNGLYRADAQNPIAQFVDVNSWDGKGYQVSVPYSVKERKGEKGFVEYRHYLGEIFNGLIECGFEIEHVEEMTLDKYRESDPKPGTWAHSLLYLPGIFTILARKR